MSTESDNEPDVNHLLSSRGDSKTSEALSNLQETVATAHNKPGLIGKLFGGPVNASNNIHGLVIVFALIAIVLFGLIKPEEIAIIDVLKAVLFLALGALAPKINNRSE